MPGRSSLEFSFSGIKTSVARWVEANGIPQGEKPLADLCASFQRRMVDVLVQRAILAARRERLSTIVLGGGVAANRELRERAVDEGNKRDIRVVVPPLASCTDNGAMIAFAGAQRLLQGERDALGIEIHPSSILPRMTRKGRGRRV
jgi:N6-L-threonylcarbamoyladenine synthase